MTAQIGYDGLDLRGDPRPELLIDVARVQPEPRDEWVRLEGRLGFRSTQRLWIGDVPGGVAVATWPASLRGRRVTSTVADSARLLWLLRSSADGRSSRRPTLRTTQRRQTDGCT